MSIGEYSVDHFQTLPSLEVARTNFVKLNGDDLVKDVFKKFFVEQGMDRTFGLAMLHRHFDLEPDEMLVDYQDRVLFLGGEGLDYWGGRVTFYEALSRITP